VVYVSNLYTAHGMIMRIKLRIYRWAGRIEYVGKYKCRLFDREPDSESLLERLKHR
jgi:hypothetical protein